MSDKYVQVDVKTELLVELNGLYNPTHQTNNFDADRKRIHEIERSILVSIVGQWAYENGNDEDSEVIGN